MRLLNPLALTYLIPVVAFTTLATCTKVLFRRTDEQAWVEFDKDAQNNRSPAALIDPGSPGLRTLHENLAAIPVRTILLKCGEAAHVELCYQSALKLQFEDGFHEAQTKYPELGLLDYQREQKSFFSYRTFGSIAAEINHFHQSILSGVDLQARSHAQELFSECETEASKDAMVDDFSILTSFAYEMPKGIYACLLSRWDADEKALLNETTERVRLSIASEEAKRWIAHEQIFPIYESEINSIADKKSKLEWIQFQQEKAKVLDGFDRKRARAEELKIWSAKLRVRYPFSPVEQWIENHAKE